MVDHILVVAGGTISEAGDYDSLLSHNGPFAQFLKTYLVEAAEEDLDEESKEHDVMQLYNAQFSPCYLL